MDVSICPSRHPGLALLQASDLFYPCVDDPYIQGNPIFTPVKSESQSNDWNRGPTELVRNFAYRGSSHRRKGAARNIIDMVWLNLSLVLVERRGVFLLVHWMISTCLRCAYRNRVQYRDTSYSRSDIAFFSRCPVGEGTTEYTKLRFPEQGQCFL